MAVYFIQDARTHAIKIGFTDGDAADRAADLQTGNPGELVVLAVVAGGTRADEAELHRRFAADRVAGEWFRPSPALLAFVIRTAKQSGEAVGYGRGLMDGEAARSPGRGEVLPHWLELDRFWHGPIGPTQAGPAFVVRCPVCGFDHNHTGRAEPHQPDGVVIPMSCEGGCQWHLVARFSKGQTFLYAAGPEAPSAREQPRR